MTEDNSPAGSNGIEDLMLEAAVLHHPCQVVLRVLNLISLHEGTAKLDEETSNEIANEAPGCQAQCQAADTPKCEHEMRPETKKVGPGQNKKAHDDYAADEPAP